MSKRRRLQIAYYLPGAMMLIRIGVTFWFLISNPMGLPLRFIQLVPIGVMCVSLFTYFKLYRDSVPLISLLLPSIIHAILIYVFKRVIVIAPFGVLVSIDILFLVIKSLKGSLFPFDKDGDDEEDLEGMFEFLQDTE